MLADNIIFHSIAYQVGMLLLPGPAKSQAAAMACRWLGRRPVGGLITAVQLSARVGRLHVTQHGGRLGLRLRPPLLLRPPHEGQREEALRRRIILALAICKARQSFTSLKSHGDGSWEHMAWRS